MTMRTSVASWSSRTRRTGTPPNQPADIAFAHISQLASAIESDPSRVEEWYRAVRIRELGGMTAHELVTQDNADLLIGFLRSILSGERD